MIYNRGLVMSVTTLKSTYKINFNFKSS